MKAILFVMSSLILVSFGHAEGAAPAAPKAKAIFQTLKAMEGTWEGQSKSGMKERLETKLIASGSVLMETSSLSMATMYHLDGDRVLLTHYCMAMNQPRLAATKVSPDGKKITFSFVDGTNLPSRDSGHMDKVVIQFLDRDTYRTKWTWYQNGKEKWMEDFTFRRVGKESGIRQRDGGSRASSKPAPTSETVRAIPPAR